jgi:hypothetical protein
MTENENPRDAAIKAFRQREVKTAQASGEQSRAVQQEAQRQQANLTSWMTIAFPAISHGVSQVSDDFARRGSPFLIRQRPDTRPGIASYEVHRSGSLHREAALAFGLDADGYVRFETDARGAKLPEGVKVEAVTAEWAAGAAEQVLFAVLKRPGDQPPTS